MLLLTNISQLLTLRGPSTPRRGHTMSELGFVTDGAVLCAKGKIIAAGKQKQVLGHEFYKRNKKRFRVIDCAGKTVLPGFVDAHTHPAFIHPRLTDFELRNTGVSYQEIAAAGGGILSSVAAVRKASLQELTAHVYSAFSRMRAHGTTTIEAKSGYGLTLKDEMKSLEAIRAAARKFPGTVSPTLLGAHVLPAAYQTRRSAYIELVTKKMIPEAARRKLAESVDVFCEEGAFTQSESEVVMAASAKAGLACRAHAGQFSPCALSGLLEHKPLSLDHLDHIRGVDLPRLAASGTIATLVPGASYFLGHARYPDARLLIESGVSVALATDFNPGTSPTPSVPFILSLGCTQMKMSPAETITAATINGAHALRLAKSKGSLETGKDADIAIFKTKDYREICYWFGENMCEGTVIAGKLN